MEEKAGKVRVRMRRIFLAKLLNWLKEIAKTHKFVKLTLSFYFYNLQVILGTFFMIHYETFDFEFRTQNASCSPYWFRPRQVRGEIGTEVCFDMIYDWETHLTNVSCIKLKAIVPYWQNILCIW